MAKTDEELQELKEKVEGDSARSSTRFPTRSLSRLPAGILCGGINGNKLKPTIWANT
jgi:hypothetical protein